MRVGIVGGGFGGLAAAIAFRDYGHTVTVFEKAAGPSAAGGAISLAQNALTCLSMLGIGNCFSTQRWANVPATVRSADGRVLVRSTLPALTGGTQYATVPRGELLGWLTQRLPADCVQYSRAVTGVTSDGSLQIGDTTERFDLVVGADGPRGLVRRTLWPSAPPLRSTGTTSWAWIADRELETGFGTIWGRTAQFGILPMFWWLALWFGAAIIGLVLFVFYGSHLGGWAADFRMRSFGWLGVALAAAVAGLGLVICASRREPPRLCLSSAGFDLRDAAGQFSLSWNDISNITGKALSAKGFRPILASPRGPRRADQRCGDRTAHGQECDGGVTRWTRSVSLR